MDKIVDPQSSGSGYTEIQIARPIPVIGASSPTVNSMAAILIKGVPGLDQLLWYTTVCMDLVTSTLPVCRLVLTDKQAVSSRLVGMNGVKDKP